MLNTLILLSALAIAEEPTTTTETVETEKVEEVVVEEKATETEKAVEEAPVVEEEKAVVAEEKVAETEKAVEEKVEAPADYNEAVETVSMLVKAIQSKNWPVVAGLALMLLVFVANKMGLKNKVGAKAIPWVSLLIGIFATTGLALANGTVVMEALVQGLSAGLAAVGSWETLFKHILGGSAPVVAEETAE